MSCQICETEDAKKVSLYNHAPPQVMLCKRHADELFLLGERRFIKKHHAHASEYKSVVKKPDSGKSSLVNNS